MTHPYLTRLLCGVSLALASLLAAAAPVSYTVNGHFTGESSDDATLIQSLAPLLGAGQSLTLTLSLDTAAPAAGPVGLNHTLYRAVTATSARFAGIQDATTTPFSGCPSASDFICTLHVKDGQGPRPGNPFDPDDIAVFPALLSSAVLNAASGNTRGLSLQFMMFFTDIAGLALADDSLNFDLAALNPQQWRGSLGVFAAAASGQGFDRANFGFRVDSIGPFVAAPDSHSVPEPASLPLALLALLALAGLGALKRQRRPATRTRR